MELLLLILQAACVIVGLINIKLSIENNRKIIHWVIYTICFAVAAIISLTDIIL